MFQMYVVYVECGKHVVIIVQHEHVNVSEDADKEGADVPASPRS